MKKLLSVTVALLMALALSLPVWADPVDPNDLPSPIGGDDISAEVVDDDDVYVDVLPVDIDTVDTDQLKEAAADQLADLGVTADDVVAIEVVDLVLKDVETDEVLDDDEYIGGNIQIAFVHDDLTKKLISVLYLDPADNTWKPAAYTVDMDGKVLVTVSELVELAFVVSEVKPAPPTPTPTAKPDKPSPQTGYNSAVWAVIGITAALCAGAFFTLARRENRA